MMARRVLSVGVLIFLSGPAALAATAPAPGAGTKAIAGIEPGEYHTVITITSLTGLPPAAAQAMMANPTEVDGCTTTGDVNEIAKEALAENGNMSCSENHASAGGGKISGAAACKDEDGDAGTMSFSGTYTPTHVAINATTAVQMAAGAVTEKLTMVSDRTGACSGVGN
jgi:hypothetical protein